MTLATDPCFSSEFVDGGFGAGGLAQQGDAKIGCHSRRASPIQSPGNDKDGGPQSMHGGPACAAAWVAAPLAVRI